MRRGAAPVTEISAHSYFLCKIFDTFIKEGAMARLGWPNQDLSNRTANVPIWTSQPGYQEKKFSSTQAVLSEEDKISIILTYFLDVFIKNDS